MLAQIASFAPNASGQLVLILDGDGVSTGASCRLEPTLISAQEAGGALSSKPLVNAIAPGESLTLIAWRMISLVNSQRIPEITCRVLHAAEMKDVTVTLSDELTTGSHVISAIDAAVDITSVSVYTSPGPKNP
jgi:hypothetical protein